MFKYVWCFHVLFAQNASIFRGRGRFPFPSNVEDMGRAIPFEELERYSKYKRWKTIKFDSNGNPLPDFEDNRNLIIQQLQFLLPRDNPYFSGISYKDMLEYGCWCNLLDEELIQGVGDAVDDLDSACRAWRRCLYCTRIDDTDCNPKTTSYDLFWDYEENTYNCEKNKGCAERVCQCDSYLAQELASMAAKFNEKLSKEGGFRKSRECSWKAHDWAPPDECCGEYPSRFPYNSNFGETQCCSKQVYQPGKGLCCLKKKLKMC